MNEKNKMQVRAVSAPWHNGIHLQVRQGSYVGTSVNMKDSCDGELIDPTISIGLDEAQTLMDDLWQAGFRPTEGSGSAGSLRATEKHLTDMRKIAFKQMDMES